MRKTVLLVALAAVAASPLLVEARGRGRGPLFGFAQLLLRACSNPRFEPTGNSRIAQRVREKFAVKSAPDPMILVLSPLEGERFAEDAEVPFELEFLNWEFRPDLATNPVEEFANGDQIPNVGHFHGWVEDLVTLEQIRFYGATVGPTFTDAFPPGIYKVYWQLQNNDHTAQVQSAAPVRPAFESTLFIVGDFELDDLEELREAVLTNDD